MITRAWHTLLFSTPWHPLLSFLKKRAHRTWSTWPFVNSRAQLSAMLSSDRRGFNQPKARFNYKQKMIVTHLSESRDFTVALHHPNMSKIVATKSRGGDLTWNPPWLIPQPPFLFTETHSFHFSPKRKKCTYTKGHGDIHPLFLPWASQLYRLALFIRLGIFVLTLEILKHLTFFLSLQKIGRFFYPIW